MEVAEAKKLVTGNRVNALLVFVPLGVLVGYLDLGSTVVFTVNFLAIIPLAALLSDTTEVLAQSVGPTLGGLLNATFGNVVELIVAVVALMQGEIRIVQTSMLGSIFSNLLLVLGCSFIAGGVNRLQQTFSQTAAQTMSSMMVVSCISMLIPAAFNLSVPPEDHEKIISVSRCTSVLLLVIYGLFLVFQLKTHRVFFEGAEGEADEEEDLPKIGRETCLCILVVVTLCVSACAEYLVDSIEGVVNSTGLSKTFIGLIVLPIVGNAAEHVTAVMMALKNKLDLTMSVAIGSSLQIALFLTPFLVVLGWFVDQPMSLFFHTFETVSLFLAVFLSSTILQDGESNWLEGVMLVGLYLIIAIAFIYFPDSAESMGNFAVKSNLQNVLATV